MVQNVNYTCYRSFSLRGGEPNLNEVFVIFTLILLCLCRLTLPQFSFTVSAQNLNDLAKEKIFKTYFWPVLRRFCIHIRVCFLCIQNVSLWVFPPPHSPGIQNLSFPPVNMAFLTYITVTETNFNETLTDLYFHKLLVSWVECCIFV